jgi:hypothetical protein
MTAHPSDVRQLELVLPPWAMECLMKNHIPAYSPPKISFSLAPWAGKGSQSDLPELTTQYVRELLDHFSHLTSLVVARVSLQVDSFGHAKYQHTYVL